MTLFQNQGHFLSNLKLLTGSVGAGTENAVFRNFFFFFLRELLLQDRYSPCTVGTIRDMCKVNGPDVSAVRFFKFLFRKKVSQGALQ